MKRALIVCGCIAALVFPAIAAAKSVHLSGKAGNNGRVELRLKVKKGQAKKAKGFRFFDIPIDCDEGHTTLDVKITGSTFVDSNNKFELEATNALAEAKIKGEVKKQGSKATGTFREQGDLRNGNGQVVGHNCDTGSVRWRATK
jgi:hypothetical protein